MRRWLEAEIEVELEAEGFEAMDRIEDAKNSLKYMRERAAEIVGVLNEAGRGNIFKVPFRTLLLNPSANMISRSWNSSQIPLSPQYCRLRS